MNIVARQFLHSNLWLIACCVFYLLWWLLAFKPVNPIHGVKSGWLLIPASITGLVAIIFALQSGTHAKVTEALFPSWALVLAAALAYVLLLLITRLVFKRPVTSELFLIVGWACLATYQINILFGTQIFTYHQAFLFIILILAVLVICMVCYTVYYRLGVVACYVVGAIPLVLGAAVMGVISLGIYRV